MSIQLDPTLITDTSWLTLHDQHSVGQEHLVPGISPDSLSTYLIPSSAVVSLREVPKQLSVTVPTGVLVTQVPGGLFQEVFSSPQSGQFVVSYAKGTITFHTSDIGKTVLVSYTAMGSLVESRDINKITSTIAPFYNKLNGIVADGGVDFTFPNDVTIMGNFYIVGVINKVASEVLNTSDDILFLNSGLTPFTMPSVAGIEVARSSNPEGDPGNPQLFWTESTSTWNFNSTSAGPTGAQAPVVRVYNKGGLQTTLLTTAQETTLVGTLISSDAGLTWFNTDTNQFMGWNGTIKVILG
jgi:hypothetical protein